MLVHFTLLTVAIDFTQEDDTLIFVFFSLSFCVLCYAFIQLLSFDAESLSLICKRQCRSKVVQGHPGIADHYQDTVMKYIILWKRYVTLKLYLTSLQMHVLVTK